MTDSSKKWYEHEENRATGILLHTPFGPGKVIVGCDPQDGMKKDTADSFDAIVNVSCSTCSVFEPSRPDQRTYWYPINEVGYWGYGVFFWATNILDYHFFKGHKIYLHCHAGAHRSPMVGLMWLYSHTKSIKTAAKYSWHNTRDPSGWYLELSSLERDIGEKHVPRYIMKYMRRIRRSKYKHSFTPSLMGREGGSDMSMPIEWDREVYAEPLLKKIRWRREVDLQRESERAKNK